MSEFLLVHGSCHGAWCWRDVVPELQSLGHQVKAIDLPSHGADKTPVEDVTLDLYAEAIVNAIDSQAIVVGHSMAGYPITAAAERAPEKIEKLIYLCAYVPSNGKTLADRRRQAPSQPLLDAIQVDENRVSFEIDPTKAAAKFFHDVDAEMQSWAIERLCPQAILPQETVIDLVAFPAIPRRYIRCSDDRTIPPEFQVTMTADWPSDHVATMDTSHSPFFSAPRDLAEVLHRFSQD